MVDGALSRLRYKVTTRSGSKVSRSSFDDLDEALAELERRLDEERLRGRLPRVTMLRSFEPGDRVAARLEVSAGGVLRGRTAGIDLMGDGSLVAYAGGIGRRPLEARDDETPVEALRRELDS